MNAKSIIWGLVIVAAVAALFYFFVVKPKKSTTSTTTVPVVNADGTVTTRASGRLTLTPKIMANGKCGCYATYGNESSEFLTNQPCPCSSSATR